MVEISQKELLNRLKECLRQKGEQRTNGIRLIHQVDTTESELIHNERIIDFRKQGEYGAKKNIKP
jgi:hypothetical protein